MNFATKNSEKQGLRQKQLTDAVEVLLSNYSKMKMCEREFRIEVIYKLVKFFGLTFDEMFNLKNKRPKEVSVEEKIAFYRIIDGMPLKTSFRLSLNKTLK
jgi:plasmid maintenance system antidote protein VapI